MEFTLRVYDEVTSTNEMVKRAIEAGEPEGRAVFARMQSAGYGRQGRSWASPAGGMYLSLLLRPRVPAAQLPTLSLALGVAVRRALVSLAPAMDARLRMKWPNDLVVAACDEVPRKICGISLESHAGALCAGVGVNVARPADAEVTATQGKFDPVYLSDCDVACMPEQVRDAVLVEIEGVYERWLAEGFNSIEREFSAHAFLTGREVTVEDLSGSVMVEGSVRGVDGFGRLLVCDAATGRVTAVSSGEAHIRR